MTITVKYDIPLSNYDVIPEGTKLEVLSDWNDHEGFIAVKYRGGKLFFNVLYFEECHALIECS